MTKEKLPTWPNGWNEDLKSRSEWLNDEQKKTLLEMLQQEKKEKIENDVEKLEIPQSLLDFRKKWEEQIDLDKDTKKKIIDAVNEIQKWAKEENDGSILVEFELWWKKYKTLDINLENHSDEEYISYDNEVRVWWMWLDNTKNRANRALAKYVDKQRDTRKMKIPTIEFQRDLLDELWVRAGLTNMSDKIAMWMYLTWNSGHYYIANWDYGRYVTNPTYDVSAHMETLACFNYRGSRYFHHLDFSIRNLAYVKLCLIDGSYT